MKLRPHRPEIQTYHTKNQNLDNRLQKTPYYRPLPLTRRSRFVQLLPPAPRPLTPAMPPSTSSATTPKPSPAAAPSSPATAPAAPPYGPYFRVAYRIAGRQCSIYFGRCTGLADRARQLLAQLQHPRDYRRMCRKANRLRRAALRSVIRGWQQTIRAYGLDLRGCEIRGWRTLGIPRYDKTTPLTAAEKAAAAIFRFPPPTQPTTPSLDLRYWQNPILVDQLHCDSSPPRSPPAYSSSLGK